VLKGFTCSSPSCQKSTFSSLAVTVTKR
jgi:hypothetical protein